jgi:hypothetical protein
VSNDALKRPRAQIDEQGSTERRSRTCGDAVENPACR